MKRSLAVFLALLLSACSLLPEVKDTTAGWSADKLYSEAKDEIAAGGYTNAIKYLEKLEARYPYGRYAQQAQIELAYVYFKDGDPTSSLAACDRFIKLHPNHPNIDYVYYLKGLVNFNEDLGLLGRISRQDLTERDPKAARDSFDAFKELITRYPDSKYTPDGVARSDQHQQKGRRIAAPPRSLRADPAQDGSLGVGRGVGPMVAGRRPQCPPRGVGCERLNTRLL